MLALTGLLRPHHAVMGGRRLQDAAVVFTSHPAPAHSRQHLVSFAHCFSLEALAVCPPGFPGRVPTEQRRALPPADGKQPCAQETWERRGKNEKPTDFLATRRQNEPE